MVLGLSSAAMVEHPRRPPRPWLGFGHYQGRKLPTHKRLRQAQLSASVPATALRSPPMSRPIGGPRSMTSLRQHGRVPKLPCPCRKKPLRRPHYRALRLPTSQLTRIGGHYSGAVFNPRSPTLQRPDASLLRPAPPLRSRCSPNRRTFFGSSTHGSTPPILLAQFTYH